VVMGFDGQITHNNLALGSSHRIFPFTRESKTAACQRSDRRLLDGWDEIIGWWGV
jgi:hypothetical protein